MLNMQNVKDIEIQEGDVRTIHDKDNRLIWGRLAYDTKYAGDTVQDGTPTPDAPIPVQVVTGGQTVTISDGVDSEDFTISLGSIELCKIGNYQDYIYKSGDDWYVHKEVGSVIYDGTEDWNYDGTYPRVAVAKPNDIGSRYQDQSTTTKCTHFLPGNTASENNTYNIGGTFNYFRASSIMTSLANWKTWLSAHNVSLYYMLATPTDTKITDATLVGQLDAVHEWLTRYGYSATVTGNLPIIINQTNL